MASTLPPNGRYGNLFSYVSQPGSGQWSTPSPNWTPQSAGLPDYLARQFFQTNMSTGGDGGQDQTAWQVGDGGIYQDSSGAHVVQVGDPAKWGQPNQPLVIDRSKVRYDNDLGYVTDPSNLKDDFDPNWLHGPGPLMLAAVLSGGAALGGFAAAGAAGAGEAAGAGLAGDESAGLAMGTAGESGGAAGAAAGAAGDESAGLGMGNPFEGAPAGGGFDPATGQWTDIPTMDSVHAGQLPGLDAYTGGNSSFLSQLNTGRQYFNGARSVMNLLSGGQGQGGPRSNGMASGNTNDFWSSLFGGNGSSGGGLVGGILGLLANGHSMFGNGVGTASGAQAAADKASAMADPWGSSGHRAQFADMLTPDRVMGLLSQDPSQVLNNPAYRFDLDQGTHAINMGDAAQGTLRSGNRGIELQNYGQGLASKYGQQYFNNNMSILSALSGLGGVGAGSPTAAAQAQMNGFDNASNIRNAGVNGVSGGIGSGAVGNTMSGVASLLRNIFSGGSSGGFDMSNIDFGNLPAFNDTSGWNPDDFFSYTDGSDSLADATGAFF